MLLPDTVGGKANPCCSRRAISFATMAMLVLADQAYSGSNPNAPLDRPVTLKHKITALAERYHRGEIVDSLPLSFMLPVSCEEAARATGCESQGGLSIVDESKDESLNFEPILGVEYLAGHSQTAMADAGGILTGHKGTISFYLDSRFFVQDAGGEGALVLNDGEGSDRQLAATTGSIGYKSFSRYRGDLSLDLVFGRFTLARDAAQWGPGVFSNLVFNQAAVPFHQLAFSTSVGPLKVRSLYGDLRTGPVQVAGGSKDLYAHRYELSVGRNLLIGMSEQLILTDGNKPYLFGPIFPLFMAKGFLDEAKNNGNLSLDAAYRFKHRGMFYAEFLLDDLESPSSVFSKNYNQNKWASMAGAHLRWDAGNWKWGAILEAAAIQPWVFSHFSNSTAQTSNADRPLGNPDGPNSLSLLLKGYGWTTDAVYLGAMVKCRWKGDEPGSDVFDPYDGQTYLQRNAFLRGAEPEFHFAPEASRLWRNFTLSTSANLGEDPSALMRAVYTY